MAFDIDIRRRVGDRDISLSLTQAGGLTAIVGPSGAGKTSLLNMVAGLLQPDEGHICVAGRTLFDSAQKTDVPPNQRYAGYVFQDRRLFPHLRVLDNLTYGLKARSTTKSANMTVEDVIAFLGIAHLSARWPASLSGGEIQRVAIARALLSNPQFLLMDEPLGALDVDRREEIITVIEKLRDQLALPILFVSHDQTEVDRLANNIIPIS
ncbi:MAG: ATP-binding cassette domain-containing protein [Sphingobium sp.]